MVLSNMKLKHKKVNAVTYLWIPLSHHICLTFNNLAHIIVDGTRRFPLLSCYEKEQIRHRKEGGSDWSVSKEKAGGKVGVWMSGMPPGTE